MLEITAATAVSDMPARWLSSSLGSRHHLHNASVCEPLLFRDNLDSHHIAGKGCSDKDDASVRRPPDAVTAFGDPMNSKLHTTSVTVPVSLPVTSWRAGPGRVAAVGSPQKDL